MVADPLLLRTFRRLGLPTSPEELGISRDQLADAILLAPTLRPDRWTILSERFRSPDEVEELVHRSFDGEPPSLGRISSATALV